MEEYSSFMYSRSVFSVRQAQAKKVYACKEVMSCYCNTKLSLMGLIYNYRQMNLFLYY